MNPVNAVIAANMVLGYVNDIKCYFRFNDAFDDYEAFNKDEFIDRTWIKFVDTLLNETAQDIEGSNLTISSLIGRDLVANDICPISYNYNDFVAFNSGT